MKVEEIRKEGLEIDIKVILESDFIESEVSKKLDQIQKRAKLPGFRPGKVPLKLMKSKYYDSVRDEVIGGSLNDAVKNYTEKNKIQLAKQPDIDEAEQEKIKNNKDGDISIVIKFELMPNIELPNFQSITLEKPVAEVDEAELEENLKSFCEANPEFAPSKGKSASGDKLTIDFEGFLGEDAFEGGKAEKYDLVLGSNSFIPGFEDQLIGFKAGDDVEVKVTFPEDYHAKNLAAKETIFKVHIHEVSKSKKSSLDEDFAKRMGYENIDDLKKSREASITKSLENLVKSYMKVKLFNSLESHLSFDMPKSMIDREISIIKSSIDSEIEEIDMLKGKSQEEINQFITKIARRRVGIGLILAHYAHENSIKVNNEDLKGEVMRRAFSSGLNPSEVFNYFMNNKQALDAIAGPILEDKAAEDIIANKINIEEKKYKSFILKNMIEEELEKIDF